MLLVRVHHGFIPMLTHTMTLADTDVFALTLVNRVIGSRMTRSSLRNKKRCEGVAKPFTVRPFHP